MALFGLAGFVAVAPVPGYAETCPSGMTAMRRLELFFGTSIEGRAVVGARAWSRFLAAEVAPRFPDGLTIFSARGQWRGTGGRVIDEGSHVLVVLYRPSDEAETKIEAIRKAYERRFHQHSVMSVESSACVAF